MKKVKQRAKLLKKVKGQKGEKQKSVFTFFTRIYRRDFVRGPKGPSMLKVRFGNRCRAVGFTGEYDLCH